MNIVYIDINIIKKYIILEWMIVLIIALSNNLEIL